MREVLWSGAHMLAYPTGLLEAAELSFERVLRPAPGEIRLRALDAELATTPIVLVHGFGHNRSAFIVMRRALRRFGFSNITTFNYGVLDGVDELAEELGAHVEATCWVLGAQRVHLVGHSLGGLIARTYVQRGGAHRVDACITLGSPHEGSIPAIYGRGRIAEQLRPHSEFLTKLNAEPQPGGVRFVALYSNLDGFVVPASSAKLAFPGWRATNILVRDVGHLSLPSSRRCIRAVLETLGSGAAGAGRAA